jgi:tRNA dimethylallyltransferase
MKPRVLLVINGPTASGKTALAIALAKHYDTHILSADSRQFYRELSIGTAKPTPEQLAQAPHHFIDSLSIHDSYSAGDFERDSLALLEQLFDRHPLVILCGGSGLFVKAVCEGLDDLPQASTALRQSLIEAFRNTGMEPLQLQLKQLDPVYAAEVDLNNPNRVMRALEVCLATGKPFSSFRIKAPAARTFQTLHIGLELPRDILYQRINQRVDDMINNGLEAEARRVYAFRHLPCLNTVGYQEWFACFDGNLTSDEAIDKIKQHTRNYAKKQMTWLRKVPNIHWFTPDAMEKIISLVGEQTGIFATR